MLHAGDEIRCRRLALPGLGALCMALTYAETPGHEPCYLWAADSRGDGHLYRAGRKLGVSERTALKDILGFE